MWSTDCSGTGMTKKKAVAQSHEQMDEKRLAKVFLVGKPAE